MAGAIEKKTISASKKVEVEVDVEAEVEVVLGNLVYWESIFRYCISSTLSYSFQMGSFAYPLF